MVKVNRTYPAPASLAIEAAKGTNGSYNEADVIDQLKKDFADKCYICELQGLQDGVVEHLIPHHGGKHMDLLFVWENLFWSCTHCNNLKNRAEYEGNIIDCCQEDPEKHINCVYTNTDTVEIHVRDAQKSSRMTAKLVGEAFNLVNTGIRENATTIRKNALRTEMRIFFKLLNQYRQNKTKLNLRLVNSRLRAKTAFAAFKRDYIRMHSNEYPELQEFLLEKI